MAEIWPKPTNKEMRKLREAYSDNLVFSTVKSFLRLMDKPPNNLFNNELRLKNDFYRVSRLMISNFGVSKTAQVLYNAIEDLAEDKLPEGWELPKEEETISINFNSRDDTPILEVAEKYGLKIKKNKSVCPFHGDSNPSLVFYIETNSFFCFGCRVGGDVLTFVQRMEEIK